MKSGTAVGADSEVSWGCGCYCYSKCNCVLLRVTFFFFYCLRLLIPSSFKLKILPFESIMHKMVSSVQL